MDSLWGYKSCWKWGQKAELAKRADISRQYLSDILNCRKRALPELALKLEAGAKAMGLRIAKEHFMYPKDAPDYIFSTPEAKRLKKLEQRERMKNERLFTHDCLKMLTGLATGKGRRPSKRKVSKRDQKIMERIARLKVNTLCL